MTRVFPNRTTHHLEKCAGHGGGEIDESKVAVKSWCFKTGRFQRDDELVVIGEREWGRDLKGLSGIPNRLNGQNH